MSAAAGGGVYDVVVAGAGLAGMAAGVRLAESGARVCVLETRKRPGGRATSFVDPRDGQTLDNCQHVVMGCCTSYLDLLGRLGSLGHIEWTTEQRWVREGGAVDTIAPGLLAPPGHFAGSLARAGFLSWGEKFAVVRAMAVIARSGPERWGGRTFGALLEQTRQPAGAIEKFWRPVVVSACNLEPERVDAGLAVKVFREGMFASARAAAIGLSRVPLVELYERFTEVVERAGGVVRFGASVTGVGGGAVEVASGESITGGRVVCALPIERMVKVVDSLTRAGDPRLAACDEIAGGDDAFSPILGVHLTFDRPVLDWPHAVLVGCRTHWVFRKSDDGSRVHAVISAADAWVGLGEDEIVARVVDDLRAWLPSGFGDAVVVSARAVKEKRATFAVTPEANARRPGVWHPEQGPASGLLLAGDYVQTGWPATMEGAVRSGYVAAGAVLGNNGEEMLAPELAPGRVAGWLLGGAGGAR